MKLNIWIKLFFAVFLSMLVTLWAVMESVQWSFRRGFDEYLSKVEEKRMDTLARDLEQEYGRYGNWDFLRDNHRYWFELLRRNSEPGRGQSPKSPAEPPFEDEFGLPLPPPYGAHRHAPPPEGLLGNGHLRVLDADKVQIVGPPAGTEAGAKEILHPVTQGGDTVGWLSLLPRRLVADRLESAFVRQHTRANYAIMGLALCMALGISLVLARQFLLPIRRLAAGAKSLAAGRYDVQIPVSSQDELGRLANDFNLLARTLKHNEETRRQWVADTSHELRTPLAILRSEIEALLDGVREANPQRLRSLHAEVMGLNKLVDDLYELSIYDLGAMNYRMETLDLVDLAGEVVDGFKTRFEGKNIQLKNLAGTALRLPISGDSGRLRQLFLNLLENSLRYTHAGGICEIAIQKTDSKAVRYSGFGARRCRWRPGAFVRPVLPSGEIAQSCLRRGGFGACDLQEYRGGSRRYAPRESFPSWRALGAGETAVAVFLKKLLPHECHNAEKNSGRGG
jgi:two-component system sensor histidine kinase BaeS